MITWAMHFASGNSLFTGMVLTIAAILVGPRIGTGWVRGIARVVLIVGVLFVLLSATPWPGWVYAVWLALTLLAGRAASLFSFRAPIRVDRRQGVIAGLSVMVACGLSAMEAQTVWRISEATGTTYRRMYVVGDSISAGMGEDEPCWPELLVQNEHVEVVNLARPGATTDSAMKQVEQIPPGDPLVLIEIGGNDLLAGMPSRDFEANLRRLIERVRGPSRKIVLLELPLPPGFNGYGAAQRRIAREFGCELISKRGFARVLSRNSTTLDGIHLSPEGHLEMSELIAGYVVPHLQRVGD